VSGASDWTRPPRAAPWTGRVAFITAGVALGVLWTIGMGLWWSHGLQHVKREMAPHLSGEWNPDGVRYPLQRFGLAAAWAAGLFAAWGALSLRLGGGGGGGGGAGAVLHDRRLARTGLALSLSACLTGLDAVRRLWATFDWLTSAAGKIIDTPAAALTRAIRADGPLVLLLLICLIATAGHLKALIRTTGWLMLLAIAVCADVALSYAVCLFI